MKKFDFKKLALMGITGSVICATQVNSATTVDHSKMSSESKPSVISGAKLDETHFQLKLTPENKLIYSKLTLEGRTLALKLANPDGNKPPEYTDPNEAVKAAQKRLEDARKPKPVTK